MVEHEHEAINRFLAAKAVADLYPDAYRHPIYREAVVAIDALLHENMALREHIESLQKALEEAKRYDMRDWNDALVRGRRNPMI